MQENFELRSFPSLVEEMIGKGLGDGAVVVVLVVLVVLLVVLAVPVEVLAVVVLCLGNERVKVGWRTQKTSRENNNTADKKITYLGLNEEYDTNIYKYMHNTQKRF